MAIKVNNTVMISDGQELANVTGCSGLYGSFHGLATVTTSNINFTTPLMTCTMSAAQSFTESGGASGRTCTLLLDTSSNKYAPTFSSNINWEGGTEPTWSGYQHWQITFTYVASNDIRASAVGYTASAPTESIGLHGTSGSPNSTVTTFGSATDLICGMRFTSGGDVQKYTTGVAQGSYTGLWTFSTSLWNNIVPSQTYYIRATSHSGISLNSTYSSSINTWNALSSSHYFRYFVGGPSNNVGTLTGVMKIEIASDSGGSNILATGYYEWDMNGTA